jgi:hypothetical protein
MSRSKANIPEPNPSGLCQCGCGQRTSLARNSDSARGWVRGKPVRYLKSHHDRKSAVDYVEEDRGYDTPCWIWQRVTLKRSGYGLMWDTQEQRTRTAHVLYFERSRGAVPPGLVLDHLCRVRNCVRPDHLEPVTPATNTRRGVATKLTVEDVLWIRRNDGKIRRKQMAAKLGVSLYCVESVVHRMTWRDVEEDLL